MNRMVYFVGSDFEIRSGVVVENLEGRSRVVAGKEEFTLPESRLFTSRCRIGYHLRTVLNRLIFNKMKSAVMLKDKLSRLNESLRGERESSQPEIGFIE